MRPVAALFVEAGGHYFGLAGVDPWDVRRDARGYPGSAPVVAHPPCDNWCQLASVNHARWGSRCGEDDGEFAAALASVRRWGGVLEHPAHTLAWRAFGLPRPRRGCWTVEPGGPGMVTEVSQVAYGHRARKRTWLYAVGVLPLSPVWEDRPGLAAIGAGIHRGQSTHREKLAGAEASRTPAAFRDFLLELARSVA